MLDILKDKLANQYQTGITWQDGTDMPTMEITANIVKEVIQYMYDDADLEIRFLTDITAVHFPDRKDQEIMVVYHLHQLIKNFRVRIKVHLPIAAPMTPSMVSIFSGANWMERETYDFYGVQFEGHPNLKRILNVEEMDYFPMLKQYPMEDPMRTDKDDEMFGRGSDY